jgi:LPS sulfotransferase NodH
MAANAQDSAFMVTHMPPFSSTIEARHDFPPYNGAIQPFIIASTQRSGSHFLGHLLYGNRDFGYPLEYLNRLHWPDWAARAGTTPDDVPVILKELLRHRTSPRGLFGIKIHMSQMEATAHLNIVGTLEALCQKTTRYISITRRDIVRQAVSFSIAGQTGAWMQGHPVANEPSYDRDQIAHHVRRIFAEKQKWEHYFAQQGAVPLNVVYEDLERDPASQLARVAEFLGVEPPREGWTLESGMQRQSTPRNDEWCRRFNGETPSLAALLASPP